METTEPLRAHDKQRKCDHTFKTKSVCSECGWQPPRADVLAQLMVLWERATFEEHLTFLRQIR